MFETPGGARDGTAHNMIWDGAQNAMLSATIDSSGGFVTNASGHGFGLDLNNTNSNITIGLDTQIIPTDRITVLFIRRKTDATVRNVTLFGQSGSTASQRCGLHFPYGDGNIYFDFGGLSSPNRLTIGGQSWNTKPDMGAAVVGKQGMAVWRNGIKIGSSATVVTRSQGAGATLQINNGNSALGDLQEFYFFAVCKQEWSDEMIAWWMAEPYAMLRSQNPLGSYFWPKLNDAAITLPKLKISGTASFPFMGSAAVTLKHLNFSGAGDVNEVGTANVTLRRLNFAGTGVIQIIGKGAVKLRRVTPAIQASLSVRRLMISGQGTLDSRGTAALTLRRLNFSGSGALNYIGTGAVALKRISIRAGAGNNPGAIALRHLTFSGAGTVYAPATVFHDLYWKYKASDNSGIATWTKRYAGSRQVQVSRRIPAQTQQEFDITFLHASTVALALHCSQDATVKVNADMMQSFDLPPQQDLIWTSDGPAPYPFTEDPVTKFYVTNNSVMPATFTVSALILDASTG